MIKTKNKPQAVIFDFWNTLIYDLPDVEEKRGKYRIEKIHEILIRHDIRVSISDVSFAYEAAGKMITELAKNNRALTIREQIRLMAETIRFIPDRELIEKLEDAYNRANLLFLSPLVPGAEEMIESLFRKYKLGLISNTERSSGKHLTMAYHNLMKRFSVTYFSDERKLRKPHPETYLTTAAELAVDPIDCVMVGDDEEKDCTPAVVCGMRAILFADPKRGIKSDFSPQASTLSQLAQILEKM
ncbi:MAG TPA: HAD family hydrolase [Caldisericia bacterium]|nr:HAD family hydrolase [Caldisericia bacterium]HOU07880.1 HAD family hydrolase [Caldisericia bacterium]HQG59643.1 HAD family hydrolase [Caldisericia bacterium]HQH48885.1 HAD family hydrolase [Caldisericia bacterium]HQJ44398.1 HAD family hydrolase [Caldisericia bacterium]